MSEDFAALAYLQWRQAVNFVKKTVRAPGRAILYLFAGLYFAALIVMRTRYPRMHGAHHGLGEPYATAAFFGAIAFLAVMGLAAASGHVSAFSGAADARFIVGSKLRERNVIVWLQLRSSWLVLARLLAMAILYAAIYPTAGSFAGMALSILGVGAMGSTFAVPVLRAKVRGHGKIVTVALSVVAYASVAALLATLAPLVVHSASPVSAQLVRLGFGRTVAELLDANAAYLALLYAIAGGAVALSYFGSTDLYPELYALVLKGAALRSARRRDPFGAMALRLKSKAAAKRSSALSTRATGAWTILWKDWLVFRQTRLRVVFFCACFVVVTIGGIVAGVFSRASSEAFGVTVGIASSVGFLVLLFLTISAAVSLAEDVRKPIWWLSAATLRARIYAWLLASSWRTAACAGAAIVAFCIAFRDVRFALPGSIAALLAVAFIRSIGLALYSLFPSKLDQQGPVAFARLLLVYVLLAPVAVAAIAAGILLRSAAAGAVAGGAVLAIEGLLLAEFAVHRIAGVGAAFAQAEES